ncbi:MAG: hypothetical protein AAF360_05975 [Pseudomonadota bacterium]
MRWALYIVGLCLVVASAFLSYRTTYGTQDTLESVADLRAEIGREREAISVLEAEWAWMNAPARLEALLAKHGAVLALRPVDPLQFAEATELPWPAIDDGLEPVALIDLDELAPDLLFAPRPRPRPIIQEAAIQEADADAPKETTTAAATADEALR